MSLTAAPSSHAHPTARALGKPQSSGLRVWLIAAVCCTSLGLAHAEDSAFIVASTDTHARAASVQPLAAAEPNAGLQTSAVVGQAADVGSTGMGLLLGAAESNPLGLVTLGLKAVAYQRIKESPPMEQPRLWGMYGALGWGAAANNLCVIAAIATGGGAAVLCPLIGLGAGMGNWSAGTEERDKATFAVICQEAKLKNPDLVCIFNGSNS
ncbi:hypothetical protein [Hydrogenophaga sp. PAMC20947]|uniref:hypothetical protein n=1 Tax=Hydrogenophaga sp. PAMC20947 TaxID=2565558 RepID=UPI00109DB9AD|nr:hypothetical protein [Hydrogenophaga sp. PAMC20947]QCB47774.1 hypothetical protein E5678_18100 [Hydrogenophaga sp. PAMC20947]